MLPPTSSDYFVTITNMTFSPPQSMTLYGVTPEDISENHSAQFEPMNIMSRSGELFSYTGGDARTVSINFDIHEDYLIEYEGKGADIREYIAQIKTLTYPEYAGTNVIPPKIRLRVGKFILFQGVCRSTTVTWKKPVRNGRYIYANCMLEFVESNKYSFAASEIFSMGDLRRV